MKKIAIGALAFLILASCCWGQQIVTNNFKAQWHKIAGVKPIDLTEYNRVSQMSVAGDRKRYVKTLPQDAQITLWQIHITYCLTTSKYTPEQRPLVEEAAKYLVPSFFQVRDLKFEAQAQDWFARIKDAFKDDRVLYSYTFEVPGDIEVISLCPLTQTPTRTIKASFIKMNDDCNCTWAGGCDTQPRCCPAVQNGCSQIINCGPFGWFKCSGLCSRVCPFDDPDGGTE